MRGPRHRNIDATPSKGFKITERFKLELPMKSYNLPNHFAWNDPGSYGSGSFGVCTAQGNQGRHPVCFKIGVLAVSFNACFGGRGLTKPAALLRCSGNSL